LWSRGRRASSRRPGARPARAARDLLHRDHDVRLAAAADQRAAGADLDAAPVDVEPGVGDHLAGDGRGGPRRALDRLRERSGGGASRSGGGASRSDGGAAERRAGRDRRVGRVREAGLDPAIAERQARVGAQLDGGRDGAPVLGARRARAGAPRARRSGCPRSPRSGGGRAGESQTTYSFGTTVLDSELWRWRSISRTSRRASSPGVISLRNTRPNAPSTRSAILDSRLRRTLISSLLGSAGVPTPRSVHTPSPGGCTHPPGQRVRRRSMLRDVRGPGGHGGGRTAHRTRAPPPARRRRPEAAGAVHRASAAIALLAATVAAAQTTAPTARSAGVRAAHEPRQRHRGERPHRRRREPPVRAQRHERMV